MKNKILKIIISVFFIISNVIFYKSVFEDVPNIYLLYSSSLLFLTEISFFGLFIHDLINEKKLELSGKEKKIIIAIVWTGVVGVGFSRILFHSSPYFNDYVNTNMGLVYLLGSLRVLYIFSSILLAVLSKNSKNYYFFVISLLNIIVGIMIWLDFDTNISAILRILMGIIYIVFLIFRKKVENEVENISGKSLENMGNKENTENMEN